jgi:hypothetical protein
MLSTFLSNVGWSFNLALDIYRFLDQIYIGIYPMVPILLNLHPYFQPYIFWKPHIHPLFGPEIYFYANILKTLVSK